MDVTIDDAGLACLFPAFLLVDPRLAIARAGPSIMRHHPDLRVGDRLVDHFDAPGGTGPSTLRRVARERTVLQLRSRRSDERLTGAIVECGGHFLLALNHMPRGLSSGDGALQMSDFGPSDPAIQALLLMGVQQALLEESRLNAAELARERQRSQELLEQVSRGSAYMAHYFNNFLSTLSLNTDRILKGGNLDAQQERLARASMEIVERGSSVTRSLMALAQEAMDENEPLAVDVQSLERFVPPALLPSNVDRSAARPLPRSGAAARRVLVVEDEPYALEALCETLEEEGFLVRGAATAQAALAELESRPFDLLLSDVVMAQMDGLALAASAVARQPGLRIVLMSGFVPDPDRIRPDWKFIRKPIEAGQLLALLDASLAG